MGLIFGNSWAHFVQVGEYKEEYFLSTKFLKKDFKKL